MAADIIRASVDALEARVAEIGAERVAAFIVEPVQGAGGIIVPPRGWLPAMREVCARHGILFIADEVITGFGRTGRWFACDHEDVQPDLMTVAKGLTSGYVPMGAALMTDPIYRAVVDNVPEGTVFGHGYTYSGHPVSACVGLAVLRLYREGLVEQVQRTGPYFQQRLAALRDHPLVGDVRGVGLLGAVELVRDVASKTAFDPAEKVGARVHAAAYRAGVLCRAMGDVIGFAPPFVCEEREIDQIVERTAEALDEIGREL